jgi:PAS domain S-box-containing protein
MGKTPPMPTRQTLLDQVEQLTRRLQEAEDTLQAIRCGEVDAIVVSGAQGEQVFSLAGAESIYRLIVQTMKEAALTVTLDGKILFSNRQFCESIMSAPEQVVGHSLAEFVVPEYQETLIRVLQESQVGPIKTRVVFRGTKGSVPTYVSTNILRQADGVCICIVGTDLSELEASTELIQKLRLSEATLQQTNLRLQLLSETARRLLESPDPLSELEAIGRKVMALLGCEIFCHCLLDRDDNCLRLSAAVGLPETVLTQVKVKGCGQGRSALRQNDCVILGLLPSVRKTVDLSRVPALWGIKAGICHTIEVHKELLGRLCFASQTRENLSPEDIALIRSVADQVGIALLRQESQAALAESEAALKRANAELQVSNAELQTIGEELNAVNEVLRVSNETLEARVEARTTELMQRTQELQWLARELTRTEERERRELAQVVHDGLQQLLVGASMNVDLLSRRVRGETELKTTLQTLSDTITESINVSRTLTTELCPFAAYEKNLSEALQWLANWHREKHGLAVTLVTKQFLVVESVELRVLLFRAVRELLFNTVKHAEVKTARVCLDRTKDGLVRIVVSDSGRGFDPQRIKANMVRTGGFGLFSLRERLDLLGGRLEIKSAPGRGSRFTLLVPMSLSSCPPPASR